MKNPITINKTTGLVEGITFYEAPERNREAKPLDREISLLVIHCTEIVAPLDLPYDQSAVHYIFTGQYQKLKEQYPDKYAARFPQGENINVSAHFVIRRDGTLIQYVRLHDVAHHAGVSNFKGRTSCNAYSIGIELEGFANNPQWLYTAEQYTTLIALTKTLMQTYPLITAENIVGHEHIAPERKTDPGHYFDWQQFCISLGISPPPFTQRQGMIIN